MLFAGEGMFLATLTGPGKVWLQSLPFSRMAGRMLAVVLLTVKLRRPEEFEAAARPDTKAAVEAFAATSLAKKTAPEALAATKATTVGEL